MIRIRPCRDTDDQRIFLGSVFKSMSEYMAGSKLEITIDANMSMKEISKALYGMAELIGSSDINLIEDDFGYSADPDDPADDWKR